VEIKRDGDVVGAGTGGGRGNWQTLRGLCSCQSLRVESYKKGNGMNLSAIIMTFLAVMVAATAATPKVALIYSERDESGSYGTNLKKMGWAYEKLENRKVGEWITRLNEFDLVIGGTLANYANTQDMGKYGKEWRDYIGTGGGLLIFDACYDSVLERWVNQVWTDSEFTAGGCAPHTGKYNGSEEIVCASKSLMTFPYELPPWFRERGFIWAHMDRKKGSGENGWQTLITCADGQRLAVLRDEGKGAVMLTNYLLRSGSPLAPALLENFWCHIRERRAEMDFRPLQFSHRVGSQRAAVELTNESAGKKVYTVTLLMKQGENAQNFTASIALNPGEKGQVVMPYVIKQTGASYYQFRITAGEGGLPLEIGANFEALPQLALQVNDRHLYPWTKTLPIEIEFYPDVTMTASDFRLAVLLDGKAVRTYQLPLREKNCEIEVPAGVQGTHQLEVQLLKDNKMIASCRKEIYRHETPVVYFRPDGTTMVKGKPFFPLGWYSVTWRYNLEQNLAFLRKMAAAGYNTVHVSIKNPEYLEKVLDEAERLGLYVVAEGFDPEMKTVRRLADKPAVLAWNPGDEPDGNEVSVKELWARYDRAKCADPNHPVYMVLCQPKKYSKYAMCADVISPDPYPANYGKTNVTVYNDIVNARAAASQYGRALWSVPQGFGYAKPTETYRVPTAAEIRSMVYQELLAGSKGLIFYTDYDGKFDVEQHPELRNAVKKMAGEIKRLEPYLLDGKLTGLKTGYGDVFAGVWQKDGNALIGIVSAAQEPRTVKLVLPDGIAGSMNPVFPEAENVMTQQHNIVSGMVKPLTVHIYEITH